MLQVIGLFFPAFLSLVVRVIKTEIIFSDGWNLNVVYFAALVVGSIFWGYCVKLFESCFTITIESEKDDDEEEILINNYEN